MTLAGWVVGLIVTALILWSPYLTSGFRSPSLHLMLDTADGCIALLVAYLVHARFVRRRYWQDRFLAQGLVLLAVANFGLSSLAGRLPGVQAGTLDIWLPLTVRLAGALCILVAALTAGRPIHHVFAQRHAWLLPLVLVVVVSGGLWIARFDLPVAFDSASIQPSAEHPLLTGHPALLTAQAFAALCFFVASIAFALQSVRRDDELLRWLGPAFALAAFARVNYLLFPSLYTDWLYTGDLLRTGCYLLLLVGAGRELKQYWTAQSRAAVLEDRRRLARELHDGVIQELGYIRSESYALPADLPAGDRIVAACDRGLDEARAAVQALGRPTDEPLGFVLHRAVRELAERYRVSLEVEVDDSISVPTDQQHALMRITREAVSNAVRHGKAPRIHVQLARSDGQRWLVVQDDGRGFDPDCAVADNTGYGLVSMRERAQSLPGSLAIDSNPGSGSVVTVTW
jgi:signal transduction histidine kinase